MTAVLLEIALRAALIALGTAVVLRLFRIQAPAIRHAAWTAVLIAMLFLPVWQAGGIRLLLPVLDPAPAEATVGADRGQARPEDPPPLLEAAAVTRESAASEPAPVRTDPQTPIDWQSVLVSLYVAGALVLVLRLVLGTIEVNRLRRTAAVRDGRLTSARCTTPITVGWLRPSLILPEGWDRWPAAKLDAVLTHEREHARRRDPLVQWLALLNRAVFWFHPLSWWLERRLSTLSEEACDVAVLAAGHLPQDYSEYLLEMARSVSQRHGRIHLVGMAMPGTGLAERLRQIYRGVQVARISRARAICTLAFCFASSAMFAAGTLARRPNDQALANSGHRFDVVSIKPCPSLPPRGPGRSGAPGAAQTSPGFVRWECVTLATLIDQAYTGPDTPLLNVVDEPRDDGPKRVRGGPSWVSSERFTIEAKASGEAGVPSPYGRVKHVPPAMNQALRAMLADRFQLQLRRVSEERPMYALALGRGGLNPAKVTSTPPDACWVWDPATGRIKPPAGFEQKPVCGNVRSPWARGGRHSEFTGHSFDDVAEHLSGVMDRYVLNKTGASGRFDFVLDFEPDDNTPGAGPPPGALAGFMRPGGGSPAASPEPTSRPSVSGPTIFKALEGLGLRLDPTRGPTEYLAIVSAEKPRPDAAFAPPLQAPSPAPAMKITFDVISIKPCLPDPNAGGRGGGNSPRFAISPGWVRWGCVTLGQLIENAWGGGSFPNNALLNTILVPPGHRPDAPRRIRGGPSWIDEERYAIEIKISGDTTDLTGSARHNQVNAVIAAQLQAMILDRFQLKLRKATEERPMYALTVASGGLKMTPTAPSRCWVRSRFTPPDQAVPPPGFEGVLSCDYGAVQNGNPRGNIDLEYTNINLKDLAKELSEDMDRYVLDKTGVDGRFTFKLLFAPDDRTPSFEQTRLRNAAVFANMRAENGVPPSPPREPVTPDGPTIFKALEALGLKLESTRGPAEYLLIESVQRPRPN